MLTPHCSAASGKGASNEVVAQQRVLQLYGGSVAVNTAMSKRDTGVDGFMGYVDIISQRDNCTRVKAMTKARKEAPIAFAKMQS